MNMNFFVIFLSVQLGYVVIIFLFAVKEDFLKNWQFVDLKAVIVMW